MLYLVQEWMFTFSSPSHLCDLSLTPVISLRLCPLYLIRKIKGKEYLGSEEGEHSGKQVLLKDLPAASLTSLFLPSLSVSQEKYSLLFSLCFKQSNQVSSGW